MSENTETAERPNRKVREGIVSSNKMDRTIVVEVVERVRHPKYNKFVMRTKKLYAHDEANDANIGDKVRETQLSNGPFMMVGKHSKPCVRGRES